MSETHDAGRLDRSEPPRLELRAISKSYPGTSVLRSIDLRLAPREVLGVLGPSGAGKTTCLKIAAGIEHPTSGEVLIDGRLGTHLPPYERPTRMVWQDGALFPHLRVFDQIAYGLRIHRASPGVVREAVGTMIDRLGLRGMERRLPVELSGGERQRVALGRALADRQATVLLLDEPLAAVDASLRSDLRRFISELQKDLGFSCVIVTHDREEALAMSDRVALLRGGELVQEGTPEQLYRHPANRFAAEFLGPVNWVEDSARRGPSRTGVRPEHILLHSDEGAPGLNGVILSRGLLGPATEVVVNLDNGSRVVALLSAAAASELSIGRRVAVAWSVAHEIVIHE